MPRRRTRLVLAGVVLGVLGLAAIVAGVFLALDVPSGGPLLDVLTDKHGRVLATVPTDDAPLLAVALVGAGTACLPIAALLLGEGVPL